MRVKRYTAWYWTFQTEDDNGLLRDIGEWPSRLAASQYVASHPEDFPTDRHGKPLGKLISKF